MIDAQEARKQIGVLAGELEEIRTRLLDLRANLPEPLSEATEQDLADDLDPASELHAILGCAVRDCLDPLVRDLRALKDPESGAELAGVLKGLEIGDPRDERTEYLLKKYS
jgi:hypothetical protein